MLLGRFPCLSPKRRLTLLDIIASLVAALAIALAMGLECLRMATTARIRYRTDRGIPVAEAKGMETWGIFGRCLPILTLMKLGDLQIAVPCSLVVLSVALLLLRLSIATAALGQDFAPCRNFSLLYCVGLVGRRPWGLDVSAWYAVRGCWISREAFRPSITDVLSRAWGSQTGSGVAACWVLLLQGRNAGELEWDWIEVFGVILGCVWIAQIFAMPLLVTLSTASSKLSVQRLIG